MNKNYLGILFALMLVLSVSSVYAALGVGSWVANDNNTLSINVGSTAEFRYGITAVTIYGGKYSIALYREGNVNPLITYVNNQATIDNGALGKFNVTPTDYGNTVGSYYILINSVDKYSSHSYRLDLFVVPQISQLTAGCTVVGQTIGTAPFTVTFNGQANGGTGAYTYSWSYGDGTPASNQLTYQYTIDGLYNPRLTITDSANNIAYADCPQITVNKAITPITVTCNAIPTEGNAPLDVAFNADAKGGDGTYSYNWFFGDHSNLTTNVNQISQYRYYNPGSYITSVTVSDIHGNMRSVSCGTITVNKVITTLDIRCDTDKTTGTVPLTVTFTPTIISGTTPYIYQWNFGEGNPSSVQGQTIYTYNNQGTFYPKLTITDNNGQTKTASCGASAIIVNPKPNPVPVLNVDSITCFPRVTDGKNQSCSVFVKSSDGQVAGNVNVDIFYSDGTSFGSCKTNSLSGGCEVEKVVHGVGTYTVYATANAPGFIGDNDKNPQYTFEVFAQRYNIINLDTYKDSNFYYPEHTFYRGQALYAKFQVYDPLTNSFVTQDIVTAAALVSLPGGRVDLSRITYSGNWYYYKLDAIPLNHDFLGDSNVFAFAFNFSGLTSGQAQVNLTILNNKPTISSIADVYVKVGQTYTIPLNNYGTDLEDKTLKWQIINTPTKFSATIDYANVLSITGVSVGDDSLTLTGYDLDNDYATITIKVHVLQNIVINNITANCTASISNTFVNSSVRLTTQVSGGKGPYTYSWAFGDEYVSSNPIFATLVYDNAGTYHPTVNITDSNNNMVSISCGTITVNPKLIPTLTASCIPNKTTGIIPLDVVFDSHANGGTGIYTYIWKFGDTQSATAPSSTSTQIVYTHIYDTAGKYNATLEILDSANNYAFANCGDNAITANNPAPTTLDITCIAMPPSSVVPFNVMFRSVVNNVDSTGPYTFTYDYGMGYNTSSQDNIAYQTYNTPGTYYPTVTVVDNIGRIGHTSCGLIVANSNNNINLIANAGGPYTGYINEALTLDASASSGNIVKYRWSFGDGTIVDTITPQVQHIYTNINRYTVTLTVFDVNGNFNYASTTATIIERTTPKTEIVRDVPDKGIFVESLDLYGEYGEILRSNDELTTQITVKNQWDTKLKNVRIIVSIPELGIETRSSLFDFGRGAEHSETLVLPLYDVAPGTYYARISIDNDQGNDQVRRVKYREIIVKDSNTKTACNTGCAK